VQKYPLQLAMLQQRTGTLRCGDIEVAIRTDGAKLRNSVMWGVTHRQSRMYEVTIGQSKRGVAYPLYADPNGYLYRFGNLE